MPTLTTTPTPHTRYERAAARYWSARDLDARLGTREAATVLPELRAAWAAVVAARTGGA